MSERDQQGTTPSSDALSDEDRYWLEKLIADVEAPEQRNYIQGFSPMRLDFMAKMLRRALEASTPQSESTAIGNVDNIAEIERLYMCQAYSALRNYALSLERERARLRDKVLTMPQFIKDGEE